MFAKAYAIARQWTRPLVAISRRFDGRVDTAVGTYFIINDEGWAFTAAHLLDSFTQMKADQKKMEEAAQMNARNPGSVKDDPNWVTHHIFWLGDPNTRVTLIHANRAIDIALIKLENFGKPPSYPVFRDPATLIPGTSVCRAGFPFNDVKATYDEAQKKFAIAIGGPLSIFPMDGMHTRNIMAPKFDDFETLYVETTTPGLIGQSGGPLFDTMGRIYGVQVKTVHLNLGFHPEAEFKGVKTVENQFLNVGNAVHTKTLMQFMDRFGVKYLKDASGAGSFTIDVPAVVAPQPEKPTHETFKDANGDTYYMD